MSELMILWLGFGGILASLNLSTVVAGGSVFIARAISQDRSLIEEGKLGFLLQAAQYLMFLWLLVTIVALFILAL